MACELGVYGLAVMGVNLALNAASKGFQVCVGNRTPSKVDAALQMAATQGLREKFVGAKDTKEFVENIKRPRRIIMMVQAGSPVDALIGCLLPLLSSGDILVDGGNEFFENTEKRIQRCNEKGILYLGMGVSGGEEGARFGPSLMPGGDRKAFEEMELILVSVAAQIDAAKAPQTHAAEVSVHLRANACVSFLGPGGCGNFVKMVHNGIEYGDMQIIAEVYSLLRHSYNMSNEELSSLFAEWNKTELNSYLIEITSQIFKKKDPQGNGYLIDEILDAAGSKGTGKWTVQQAAEWGVPVPCLSAALEMRYISAHRGLRERLGCLYTSAWQRKGVQQNLAERPSLEELRRAVYLAKICCYAQGMHLIATVSKEKQWNLNLAEISRIWKGGCIIRARFLETMEEVFRKNPQVENLLLADGIKEIVVSHLPALQRALAWGLGWGVRTPQDSSAIFLSLPAFSAAQNYICSFLNSELPTNLIQAQRDLFGAHMFERKDKRGEKVHEPHWTQS